MLVVGRDPYWMTTMNGHDFSAARSIGAVRLHRRLVFRYYQDRYAAMLLESVLHSAVPIRDLRRSRYGRLLDRPSLKVIAASKGDGCLRREDLLLAWPSTLETYVLSFSTWGSEKSCDRRWNQTSRNRRQLALQLNFSRQHDEHYQRLIHNAADRPFVNRSHPVNREGRNTLAWSRIDVDIFSGEALIEECQNDWVRRTDRMLASAIRGRGMFRERAARDGLATYANSILAPHAGIWSEAMLSATLHVLGEYLGIGRIWFHDFDTGCEIKQLWRRKPPRSLYSDLPKRFCFDLTDESPAFILPAQPRWLRQKLERGKGRFWRLDYGRLDT